MYVACTQKTPNLRCRFLKRRLKNAPRRFRLAHGQLSSIYPPSPSFSSFDAASMMLCCSPLPASSSTPLRPSLCYPSISLVVNIMFIIVFCGHLNVIYIFDPNCIVLKSGWSSTARMPRLVVSSPSLSPSHPRRHRQADGQLSSLYPPSPRLSSFSPDCVKLCCFPSPSFVRNTRIFCLVYV